MTAGSLPDEESSSRCLFTGTLIRLSSSNPSPFDLTLLLFTEPFGRALSLKKVSILDCFACFNFFLVLGERGELETCTLRPEVGKLRENLSKPFLFFFAFPVRIVATRVVALFAVAESHWPQPSARLDIFTLNYQAKMNNNEFKMARQFYPASFSLI